MPSEEHHPLVYEIIQFLIDLYPGAKITGPVHIMVKRWDGSPHEERKSEDDPNLREPDGTILLDPGSQSSPLGPADQQWRELHSKHKKNVVCTLVDRPDIVIEITSKSNRRNDILTKWVEYAQKCNVSQNVKHEMI